MSQAAAAGGARTGARTLALLGALYFAQGLPFGFQASALPVFLRERGVSLRSIGLLGLLSLPWAFKALWAPLVDRYGSARLGRRRSWILPLQLLLAAACAAGALAARAPHLSLLLGLVFLMNLLAATQDIAVDGLAVDVLAHRSLGLGNVAQVVGYKLGMLTGGGLLVWASGSLGWAGVFVGMGLLSLGVFGVTLAWRERPARALAGAAAARQTLGEVLGRLWAALRLPGTGWLLAFVATYKLGETMADVLFKPFLVDAGYSAVQIGQWVGTWGMLASLAGSAAGGLLALRLPLLTAVGLTAALRVVPLAGRWWLATGEPTPGAVLAVTLGEELFGGALTTAMFAFMMARVDRRVGASHFTLLASVELAGKALAGPLGGALADGGWGYAGVFRLATLLSLAFLALLVPMHRVPRALPLEERA